MTQTRSTSSRARATGSRSRAARRAAASARRGTSTRSSTAFPVMVVDDGGRRRRATGRARADRGRAARRSCRRSERDAIDPYVAELILGTCGNLYRHLARRARRATRSPTSPLPPGTGGSFLELGCNWGRWCVAAARRGYRADRDRPVARGDPRRAPGRASSSASRRHYVVADARHLPFADGASTSCFPTACSSTSRSGDALAALRRDRRAC